MLESIEGEKVSPENKNNEFGYFVLNYVTLALKFTIPPLLYFC
jgi:hypothetical protein